MKKLVNLSTESRNNKNYHSLVLIAFAFFTWGIGEGLFFYFQPIYMEELGASPIIIGGILGLNGLAMTLVQAPAGYLADKLGNRTVMKLAWITGTLSTIIMAFSNSLLGFSIGWIVYGISAVSAATSSYITNVRGTLSVGRAMTLISGMYHLGAFIGPMIGGEIGQRLGLQIIYRFSIVFFIASSIIIFFAKDDKETGAIRIKQEWNPLRYRPFIILLGLCFITIFSGYLAEPLTPNFLRSEHHLSLSEIGRLGSIGSLGNAIITLVFGGLNPLFGIMLGHSFLSLFSVFIWQGTGMVWFAFGFFLRGGYRIFQAMYLTIARELFAGREMGLAYGWMATANSLAIILAPPAAGLLYQISSSLMYPVTLILLLMTFLVNFFLIKYLEKNVRSELNS